MSTSRNTMGTSGRVAGTAVHTSMDYDEEADTVITIAPVTIMTAAAAPEMYHYHDSDSEDGSGQFGRRRINPEPSEEAFTIGDARDERNIELPHLMTNSRNILDDSSSWTNPPPFANVNHNELELADGQRRGTSASQLADRASQPRLLQSRDAGAAAQMARGDNRLAARLSPSVKQQLANQKKHKPIFTYVTAVMQIAIMVCALFPDLNGHRARFGLGADTSEFVSTDPFYAGSSQQVSKPKNLWFGPDTNHVIQWGAKYTPCMRTESWIKDIAKNISDAEQSYGCCMTLASPQQCGMLPQDDCSDTFYVNFTTASCADVSLCQEVVLRPCCYGIRGQCATVASDYCSAIGGTFHDDKLLCSEVDCVEELCQMGGFHKGPDQWWRLFTAIFMHIGLIHLFANVLFQYTMVREIEIYAGPIRTGLMYFTSGVGGNIIASIFSPESVSAGSSGALYGMIGVSAVDTFNNWQLLESPFYEVFRLLVTTAIVLGIGTLPWIDNWAHLGGFVVGVISGIAFLPFLEFGKWDGRRKNILQFLAGMFLIALAIIGMIIFYKAPDPSFCSWCHYINCVPYTKDICSASQNS